MDTVLNKKEKFDYSFGTYVFELIEEPEKFWNNLINSNFYLEGGHKITLKKYPDKLTIKVGNKGFLIVNPYNKKIDGHIVKWISAEDYNGRKRSK